MSRFNTPTHKTQPAVVRATSPMGTTSRTVPDTLTFENGPGWAKSMKTDLFLRATSSLQDGSGSFYESGKTRDEKLIAMMRQVAVEDIDWAADFLTWLRGPGNIRTAAIILAPEAVDARLKAGLHAPENSVMPTNREIIASVLQRPDEPGEMLAYWTATHGRSIPKPIKRGIADAVRRMYNEHALLKYDTTSHTYRFGDILNLVHATPHPDKAWQGELFLYALDRRHHPATAVIPPSLVKVARNKDLRDNGAPEDWLDAQTLSDAGMTWEDAFSAVGSKVPKSKLWGALIPSMGYMALLKNLRNFDEAGISDLAANKVVAKLVDPSEVARSRQLPFRYLSAYQNAPSLRWGYALETALELCLSNIPEFPGRTLVLTDTSGSMTSAVSAKSKMQALAVAGLFGAALARRNQGHVDLYQYADRTMRIDVPKGGSTLRVAQNIVLQANSVGYGTNIEGSIRETYGGHDRVIVLTDAQGCSYGRTTAQSVGRSVPSHIPLYLFNIESYSSSPMPTGGAARFDIGGLTDHTFKMIAQLESGKSGVWPWEIAA